MEEIKKAKAKMTYKLRGDTAQNWENLNPILSVREPALILNENGKTIGFKIGDGVTDWHNLEFHNIDGGGGFNVTVDQTYSPKSENPQSGKAVAEAIANIDVSGSYTLTEEDIDSIANVVLSHFTDVSEEGQ